MSQGNDGGAGAFAGAEASGEVSIEGSTSGSGEASTRGSGEASTSGGSFWDQAMFAVKGDKGSATAEGWLKGDVTSGPGSGGFEMDPESAEDMVKQAKSIAMEMQEQYLKAEGLIKSEPPAKDPGSEAFQSVAVPMFGLGADSVKAQWQRYTDIAVKLEKALEIYNETDEQAGKDAKKSSGGLLG
ncbi:hypothetical protein GCM10009676_42420 [Prauserella halophila]|uniref:PE family protein n=1 Tax=Prauserella halophila TaxID=185641 RepID=A0ABN1WLS7_9PSEU|nr:hypothetical protein [Prauserella halophila]MCP2237886.1 hypothetical protein [Prauserella halophila]